MQNTEIPLLVAGDLVVHSTFGIGEVGTVSGEGDKAMAEINFNAGWKRLVLKYAPVAKLAIGGELEQRGPTVRDRRRIDPETYQVQSTSVRRTPTPGAATSIKAIETRYRGYRFRSRLEARWAVFFDHMEYEWDYEAEGYELPSGKYYLPDFTIKSPEPGFAGAGKLGVEVKGDLENFNDWDDLIELSAIFPITLLSNIPEPAASGKLPPLFPIFASDQGHGVPDLMMFCDAGFWRLRQLADGVIEHHLAGCRLHDLPVKKQGKVEDAFRAARSARFEHGETPA